MPRLYSSRICPFAHRTRLTLREKGIEFELVEIDLESMPEWYRELSPNQKVPLLELEDGQLVWESAVICEYLEEAFSGPALMPGDALGKARVRLAVELGSARFIPGFYQVLRGAEPQGLLQAVDQLEAHDWEEGPWWLGPQLTLADLELYPWFERWCVLEHYRALGWDSQRWPRLTRWRAGLEARPSVQADRVPNDDFVRAYRRYAKG